MAPPEPPAAASLHGAGASGSARWFLLACTARHQQLVSRRAAGALLRSGWEKLRSASAKARTCQTAPEARGNKGRLLGGHCATLHPRRGAVDGVGRGRHVTGRVSSLAVRRSGAMRMRVTVVILLCVGLKLGHVANTIGRRPGQAKTLLRGPCTLPSSHLPPFGSASSPAEVQGGMASAGELCPACFSGALQLHEGMLVCDVCGSIHQVITGHLLLPVACRRRCCFCHCHRHRHRHPQWLAQAQLLSQPPCRRALQRRPKSTRQASVTPVSSSALAAGAGSGGSANARAGLPARVAGNATPLGPPSAADTMCAASPLVSDPMHPLTFKRHSTCRNSEGMGKPKGGGDVAEDTPPPPPVPVPEALRAYVQGIQQLLQVRGTAGVLFRVVLLLRWWR